jgi:predicted TIM-barrel fold metal-dependent hydrolase
MSQAPICAAPDPNPRPPKFRPPAGAADCHVHLFGPPRDYPFFPVREYTPPEAPVPALQHLLAALGLQRAVIVQPSVYGQDNRATLDGSKALGANGRAVVVIDSSVTDAELEAMHAAGARGVRVNLKLPGGIGLDELPKLVRRIAPLGWHIQFFLDVSTFEHFDRMVDLGVPSIVDHMGAMPARRGVNDPGFRRLLDLLGRGKLWVKLSGAYRLTGERMVPYRDVTPLARALVAANPEQLVWASDWPHTHFDLPMPNDGDLLDALADWAPDEAVRNRILAANAARFYGFT